MAHIVIDGTSPRVRYTVGTKPQAVFAVPFAFFEDAGLQVYTGTTLKTLDADYTVSGAGSSGGGTVTLTASVVSTTVTSVRAVPVERTTDFPGVGPFQIDTLNTELDRPIAIVQPFQDQLNRTVALAEDDANATLRLPRASSRANKALIFDANGNLAASNDFVGEAAARAAMAEAMMIPLDHRRHPGRLL